MIKKFNDYFLIGAATAAHQVEGNNIYSDCWVMENVPNSIYKEPSLDAVDHYHKYKGDIRMLAEAGLNAYRFSIEWARIEPEKGVFDTTQVNHYKDVLMCCQEYGLTPIVTLHHFSSPKWLIQEGGWESESTIEFFARYCKFIVENLGDLMTYICTINEANMGLQIMKIMQGFIGKEGNPKNETDIQVGLNMDTNELFQNFAKEMEKEFAMDSDKIQVFLAPRTKEGDILIMKCHERAREEIKKIKPNLKVGITMSLFDYQALPGGESFVEAEQGEDFLHYLPYLQGDDFFGVQNYTRKVYGKDGLIPPNENTRLTGAGYEYCPEALEGVLRYVAKHWDRPILITENGVCTSEDENRIEFIERAINGVCGCVEDGIPILGYMHWSLLDNYEWQIGFEQQYGLIAVDRKSQIRYPKKSLYYLGNIRKNGINN